MRMFSSPRRTARARPCHVFASPWKPSERQRVAPIKPVQHNNESRLTMTSGHLGNYTILTDATGTCRVGSIDIRRHQAGTL